MLLFLSSFHRLLYGEDVTGSDSRGQASEQKQLAVSFPLRARKSRSFEHPSSALLPPRERNQQHTQCSWEEAPWQKPLMLFSPHRLCQRRAPHDSDTCRCRGWVNPGQTQKEDFSLLQTKQHWSHPPPFMVTFNLLRNSFWTISSKIT